MQLQHWHCLASYAEASVTTSMTNRQTDRLIDKEVLSSLTQMCSKQIHSKMVEMAAFLAVVSFNVQCNILFLF